KNCYPSAQDCAECHQRIYDEWSVSSHAYAYVSPMFHAFENKLTILSEGTVGHFCTRCHSPIATAMNEARSTPLGDLAEVAREGVTCIVCHRVNQAWGKSNGDRRVVPGELYAPVYGGVGGEGVAKAIAEKEKYKVKTSPEEKGPGQPIHTEGRFFDQLTRAEACTSCHQVAVHPGIKLEVVWEQYRASPACKKGVTCQECHMGRVPGVAAGWNTGPIAELNGKVVSNQRKQSSHIFYGPGYSIAHPGVFPQNKDAARWTVDEWLLFDWRAGWGTDDFEDRVEEAEDRGVDTAAWFPAVWADIDDRCDAREIVEDNLDRLKKKRRYRELVMENGSKVDGPFFRTQPTAGRDLKFEYVVANLNEGHNLPTASLGAQPQLWANVVLVGPDGRRVWESGYTDTNGDLADTHSVDVRHGRVPFDKQLFNLQTMFLITGATGTDREFFLPVNLDIDQVAHLRPGTIPISVTNHPPFIRMESRSIAPLGKKRVKYTVPASLMTRPGRYRLSFRLRSRTEPMYFMRFCDATPEMMRSMTEGTLDIHPQSVEFDVPPAGVGVAGPHYGAGAHGGAAPWRW
ncbi:MAG: multiheme c-type cytochrome, partial [Planctomycetota bacterium]